MGWTIHFNGKKSGVPVLYWILQGNRLLYALFLGPNLHLFVVCEKKNLDSIGDHPRKLTEVLCLLLSNISFMEELLH